MTIIIIIMQQFIEQKSTIFTQGQIEDYSHRSAKEGPTNSEILHTKK